MSTNTDFKHCTLKKTLVIQYIANKVFFPPKNKFKQGRKKYTVFLTSHLSVLPPLTCPLSMGIQTFRAPTGKGKTILSFLVPSLLVVQTLYFSSKKNTFLKLLTQSNTKPEYMYMYTYIHTHSMVFGKVPFSLQYFTVKNNTITPLD